MYSVLNKISEYKYFYVSKNITSYAFLLVFKFAESVFLKVIKTEIAVRRNMAE